MADITDPVAITFCNEQLRPLAERLRDSHATLTELKGIWLDGMGDYFTDSAADMIIDDRQTGGVEQISCATIDTVVSAASAALAALDAAGVMAAVRTACVRPLRVQGD